jgi:predicted branched-subunit amino acid permease
MVYSFGITDETFSVVATKEGTTSTGFMYGVNLLAYSSWVIFTGVGHLIGASLPQTLQESMGIALYAMFVGLLVPSLKKSGKVVFLAALAAIFNSIFTLGGMMAQGWSIVASTILSAVLMEMIEMVKAKHWGVNDEK